jgi:hypothetical protein
MIKKTLWMAGLVFCLPNAWAFSLLGPVNNGLAVGGSFADTWQSSTIGYNPLAYGAAPPGLVDGDLFGPKNLGEEYRRNTPFLFYAADANFLDYFGSNGVVAVDQACATLNNVFANTNVPAVITNGIDAYSAGLTEFPLNTENVNYQAQNLLLIDLKSEVLALLTEQLGLADAVRYTWCLHNRYTGAPNSTCPSGGPGMGVEYTVIQRNFDITASPLNQLQYSAYVNGMLFDYVIIENCGAQFASPPDADAVEVVVDPLFYNPPVASGFGEDGLQRGGFFTGLTRDDVAGLRYLLSTNNLITEDPPSGSLVLVTNLTSQQLITTLPLGLFLAQAQTNDPATLQTLYPGLLITSTTTNYTFVNATNITPYYTNLPGPTVTNYAFPQLVTNLDLALFSAQALTDAPPVLQALYPGLVILSATPYFTNLVTTNIVAYITNDIGGPYGSTRTVVQYVPVTNYFVQVWSYIFGNLVTNSFSTNGMFINWTVSVGHLIGAPYGSAATTNITYTTNAIHGLFGSFFIVPTNWCGYVILASNSYPGTISSSNTIVIGSTNSLGTAQFTYTFYTFYNQEVFWIEPGVCEPALVFATNISGTIATNYLETFANVKTNSYFPNSLVTIVTTNIYLPPGAVTNAPLVTNVTSLTVVSNSPSGDFWIVPTAWNCGYTILSVPFTSAVGTTNTTVTTVPSGLANLGQRYSVTTISYYTNHSLLIQPIICQTQTATTNLFQGLGRIQFVRANYDSLLGQVFQPITNVYSVVTVTNNQAVTQTYERVVTTPDILFSASDQSSGPANMLFNGLFTRGVTFDQNHITPGLAGPGTIITPSTIALNKVGPVYYNYGPNYVNGPQAAFMSLYFIWGSFDGSTNAPIVYPNGSSIQNLADEVLIQIYSTPPTLPTATNGFPYSASFSATGGQTPYTWSLGSGTQLPQNLTLTGTSTNATISGMVTNNTPGVYVFTVQLTDSANRTESLNYFITVYPPLD